MRDAVLKTDPIRFPSLERALHARTRASVRAALARADAWPDRTTYAAERRQVTRHGTEMMRELRSAWRDRGYWASWIAISADLGMGMRAFPRVLGFGSRHARALASLTADDARRLSECGRLGGLLNLGIVLFDRACDSNEVLSRTLFEALRPAAIPSMAESARAGADAHGHSACGLILDVVARFLDAVLETVAPARLPEVERLIHRMYAAEQWTASRRASALEPHRVMQYLHDKSVLPLETTALLCAAVLDLEPNSEAVHLVSAGRSAGRVCWIIDDLVDAAEDWQAGHCSRIWTRSPRTNPHQEAFEDLEYLLESDVFDREAAHLAHEMQTLRCLTDSTTHPSTLPSCMSSTIVSWLGGPEDPHHPSTSSSDSAAHRM